MDRALDSLSSDLKPLVMDVLARLVERGIAVMIVQTGRTLAEHQTNLASGASAVPLSKHLPRRLRWTIVGTADDEKSDAIDLCPYSTYQLKGDDKLQWKDDESPEATAAFAAIGELGEAHGLRWGGRWQTPHDPGHLEWLFPAERHRDIPPTSAAYREHGMGTP